MTNVESRKNDRTRIPKNKVIGAPIDYSSFGFLSTFGFRHWVHLFVILQIRDKLPRGIRLVWQKLHRTPMTWPRTSRKPTFFWQAVLILLPVVVLAAMGFFSLRQDRLLDRKSVV